MVAAVLEEVPTGVCPSSARLVLESATPVTEARTWTLSALIRSVGTTAQTTPITIIGNFMADFIRCDAPAVSRFVSLPEYSLELSPGNDVREFVRLTQCQWLNALSFRHREWSRKPKGSPRSRSLFKFNKTSANTLV